MALVVCLKIAQMTTTVSDHLEKTSAGMKILWVLLEMLRKFVDLTRKKRDLDIWRASIRVVPGDIFDDRLLFPSGKH